MGPFDEESTRAFYSDVPDYLPTLPLALLNLTPEDVAKLEEENEAKYGSFDKDVDDAFGDEGGSGGSSSEDAASDAADAADDERFAEGGGAEEQGEDGEDDEDDGTESIHYKLKMLLDEELPNVNGREAADKLAEKFITNHGSLLKARKRLAKTLYSVPRTRLDLLPQYSRFLCAVDKVLKDVAVLVVAELEREFR